MNKSIAEQVNKQANIYFSYINGVGCAINSRITDWSKGTTLLFYYDKATYMAEYDTDGNCKTVKQTGENTMRNYTVIQMTTGRAYTRKPRVIKHNGQF